MWLVLFSDELRTQSSLFWTRFSALGNQSLKVSALPKTTPLLAYLLLHRSQPVSRTALAFTLWTDVGENEARSNLRRHLYDLRQILPTEPEGRPWLLTETATIQWNPQSDFRLDVDHFVQCSADPVRLGEAIALYTGDLLSELSEDWLFFEPERLRNLFLDNLAKLVSRHRQQQEYGAAIAFAQRLLIHDPLREDAVRELMSLRYENGDCAGALDEYRRFEQRVRSELDVEPMLETKALYDSIAKNLFRPTSSLPPVAPALNTNSLSATSPIQENPKPSTPTPAVDLQPPHNLPAQLTSFIGRELELATLSEWLLDPHSPQRLITLTGAGGSGKSRLASEALARVRIANPQRFPHGSFAVWLSDLQQPDQVLPAIAKVLNLSETPGRPLLDTLQNYLRSKQLCLLLDNFEHLLAAALDIHRLLAAAQNLVVIATSRAPLQVYGEHEFPILPLSLPNTAAMKEPTMLAKSAAVALFVARSRAVNPNFALNPKNSSEIVEICRRLDGLPLALELAAARSKLLTPQALLARLTTGSGGELNFLADRNRTQNERHQTLQATIEWSYKLLTPVEQQLFTYLAIFAGNFTLEQAEAICDLAARGDLFERLEVLVNSSLLRQVEEEGEIRFRYLWTIRDFARTRLTHDPTAAAQLAERHARYFLLAAQGLGAQLYGFQQQMAHSRLQAAHANLHAALEWSIQQQAAEVALGFANALFRFWISNSHLLSEGRAYLAKMLALPGAQAATAARACALIVAANLETMASVLVNLADLAFIDEEYAQADAYARSALDLFVELGEKWQPPRLLRMLGLVAIQKGDLPAAIQLCWQAIERNQELSDFVGISACLVALASVLGIQDEWAQATQLLAIVQHALQPTDFQLLPADRNVYERTQRAAQATLTAEDFAAAWRTGASLTLAQALQRAPHR